MELYGLLSDSPAFLFACFTSRLQLVARHLHVFVSIFLLNLQTRTILTSPRFLVLSLVVDVNIAIEGA